MLFPSCHYLLTQLLQTLTSNIKYILSGGLSPSGPTINNTLTDIEVDCHNRIKTKKKKDSFGDPVAASACTQAELSLRILFHTHPCTCSTRGRHRLCAASAPTHTLHHTHMHTPATHLQRMHTQHEGHWHPGTALARAHCCRPPRLLDQPSPWDSHACRSVCMHVVRVEKNQFLHVHMVERRFCGDVYLGHRGWASSVALGPSCGRVLGCGLWVLGFPTRDPGPKGAL